MSGYPIRLQMVWMTLLALAWWGLCAPWSMGWTVLACAVIVCIALVALMTATRRMRSRRQVTAALLAAVDDALRALPADLKRHTPLVLTIGESSAMTHAWGDEVVRLTDAGLWVRCDAPDTLMHVADALKRWRDGQGPDAVMLLVAADQNASDEQDAVTWKRWRSAIGAASRAVGYPLPVGVAIYAEERHRSSDSCPWFGISGAAPIDLTVLPSWIATRLEHYVRAAKPTEPVLHAHRAAQLNALVPWAAGELLPMLMDGPRGGAPVRITAFGVTAVAGLPAHDAPFARTITERTGLKRLPITRSAPVHYPLPDALGRGMARQPVRRPWLRALAHAFVGLAMFIVTGAAASAWQNRAWVQHVIDDIHRYQSLDPSQDAARIDALNAVKQDRDVLERYAHAGVPPRLGFGLYRGGRWLPVVNRLIADYQPPAPPPTVITLDSMSLFDSGKAQLKAGSTRALVRALDMIKAHPHKRVLVAGYTDSVGNPQSNLVLSKARASAVRDWLIDASGLSPTRFAIQGYGDTRPRASNDTEFGRAVNRRVDITLIPDCRDGRDGRSPQGPAACS